MRLFCLVVGCITLGCTFGAGVGFGVLLVALALIGPGD